MRVYMYARMHLRSHVCSRRRPPTAGGRAAACPWAHTRPARPGAPTYYMHHTYMHTYTTGRPVLAVQVPPARGAEGARFRGRFVAGPSTWVLAVRTSSSSARKDHHGRPGAGLAAICQGRAAALLQAGWRGAARWRCPHRVSRWAVAGLASATEAVGGGRGGLLRPQLHTSASELAGPMVLRAVLVWQ